MADEYSIPIVRIEEHRVREGCFLKHLLKPLAADSHGRGVAEANRRLLDTVKRNRWQTYIANVKIIGPWRRNLALVNLYPLPPQKARAALM